MRGRLGPGLWLVVAWTAFWADITPGNLLSGVVVAAGVLMVFPNREAGAESGGTALCVRPLPALRFLGYFLAKLVESNAVVAWEVVTPWNRLNEAIVRVPLQSTSSTLATIVANAVTLTPGTLTLEARPDDEGHTLFVHVLHLRSVEHARGEVRLLEYLAVQAFGDEDACRHVVDPRNLPVPYEEV